MERLIKLSRIPLVLGLVGLLAACGAKPVQVQGYDPVADTEGLERDTSEAPGVVLVRPGAPNLNEYERFIIDPVILIDADYNNDDLDKEKAEKMQQYLQQAVIKELEQAGYQVGGDVDKAMRITFKISGLKVPSAAANITTVLAPFALSVGEVTIETVFREAATDRIDAVAIMQSRGSRFFNATPWSTWEDIKQTFDNWAESFRKSVDKAHKK
ncbi:DUF3313 family protein [Shewanella maritima]|uniref:DUF3313 family protein n=1 Tax=Shewanella maritima TaxID=2520507 RepID=UPI003734C371